MTIAACYLSAEGVVFGADSTSTMFVSRPAGAGGFQHHFNFAQKIFQIGDNGDLAIAMWGLGNLHQLSYRTLIAQFNDQLKNKPSTDPQKLADRWATFFWREYSTNLKEICKQAQGLYAIPKRTHEEQTELENLIHTFSGGFCFGGKILPSRTPFAFEILYSPIQVKPMPSRLLQMGGTSFWGCPNLMERLLFGIDSSLFKAIIDSGKWSGSEHELVQLVVPHRLSQPFDLPIREAIDWVYTSIYTTNQVMKFSHLPPVCGGPVEIAVITTDRSFRWVRHKRLDAAIGPNGQFNGQQ